MHKRYLLWLLLLCCLTLMPAIALNLVLLRNEGDITAISFAASDWQQQSQGITFTPTMGNNYLFKTLRLNDRLPEINTVVFGSSTGMPISTAMLPQGWRPYNFTLSGSPLSTSIAQAEYLVKHEPQIKHYIIALDWSLGFVYQSGEIPVVNLASPQRNQTISEGERRTLIATLKEAMSYPRMEKLWKILRDVAKSPQSRKTFREYFLQLGSNEYLCPDGKSKGMDFGIYNRGFCDGFRYDGSATYSDRIQIENANRLIISALAYGSKYARALQHTHGAIDPGLFVRLASLNQAIAANGGKLLLYMPPLMPGLEAAFLKHPLFSTYLLHTKRELDSWAAGNGATVVDFGQSEKFGCTSSEFRDEHHADPACYSKIFRVFWQNGGIQNLTQPNAATRAGS